jgi:hypothetical protein
MSRSFIFALRSRRAVSEIIGGVIILALLLTALAAVVLVTQQYDQYQQSVNQVAHNSNQQLSEDLVAISPGLTIVNGTISGWSTSTSTCGTTTGTKEYNCYEATISNVGAVGVQIVRIYVNSTGGGCASPNPQPCILNPSIGIGPYTFNAANQFINPGAVNYQVAFALPTPVALPDPNPPFPKNSISIATSRGNVFTFQWPLQPMLFGQSNSAYSQGNMRIAYTKTGTGGYDSMNEPLGGTGGTTYCHTETAQPYPAAPGYAEKLTGITGYGDSGVMWFVNPWVTLPILQSGQNGATTFYLYVIVINTGTTYYSPTAGTLDLTWYGSNHVDGEYIGIYYDGAFTAATSATQPSIAPGSWYYAMFSTGVSGGFVMVGSTPTTSTMWWGGASITNNLENANFYSGTVLVSGLWVRMTC